MRPELESIPAAYRNYVAMVTENDLIEALRLSMERIQTLVSGIPESRAGHRYAEGKWSIGEVLCHLMDCERVFAYRALRFARGDRTPLAGFDQDVYAPQANAAARTLDRIGSEMAHLRICTIELFDSFTPEMLDRKGEVNHNVLSAAALGYIIAGHDRHHWKVMQERYL
jgi:hypothetical protein